MDLRTNAKIWWPLWRYFPDLKGKIGPDTINQTGNAFTMQAIVHGDFGDFEFGFEQQHGSILESRSYQTQSSWTYTTE
ncbi:hypothetical protein SGCOL_003342 [Colletotrichum sp. CLE4]